MRWYNDDTKKVQICLQEKRNQREAYKDLLLLLWMYDQFKQRGCPYQSFKVTRQGFIRVDRFNFK